MKLKECKRVMAMLLAGVLTISSMGLPSVTAGAAQPMEAAAEEENAGGLRYGEAVLDGTGSVDISQDADFFNAMENFEITMVYRFREPQNKKYALFTLESGAGDYITVWHNPRSNTNNGQISVVYKGCTGLYWSRNFYAVNDTNWHKLSFALNGASMYVALDGDGEGQTSAGTSYTWFDYTNDFLKNHTWSVAKAKLGGVADTGDYSYTDMAGFDGTIKYAEISSDAYDQSKVTEKNAQIPSDLKAEFDGYLEECNALASDSYTAGSWQVFEAARTAAAAATTEWAIYNTYEPLAAAREALQERRENNAPEAKENVSRTLVRDRVLTVSAAELAADADGDELAVTAVSGNNKVAVTVEDGEAKVSCSESGVSETFRLTVTDGIETVDVPFTVDDVEDRLLLAYDEVLWGQSFDGTNTVSIPLKDARMLSQLNGSLELSFTFRYESAGKTFVYLMEVSDSSDNQSDSNDNGGVYTPAKSTMAVLLKPDSGTVYLNTGAYAGSTAWTANAGKAFTDGKYHTLTVSVAPDALRFRVDGEEMKTSGTDENVKNTKKFVSAFFGNDQGANYRDWRADIDSVTIGGCSPKSAIRHTNYGKFAGEFKSVVITDGGYSEEAFAQNRLLGADKAMSVLSGLLSSVREEDYDAASWKAFTESAAYTTAKSLDVTHAAYEIYEAAEALKTAIATLKDEVNLDTIGGRISEMFAGAGDESWLFAGGAETQGRFSEIAGVRNFVGQFEEYIRWVKATQSQLKRQRYTINVGKAGEDLTVFETKLDGYIETLDPKAVAYLIGSEDYSKGEDGVEAFKAALASVIEKALQMRDNSGFAVISLPHAVKEADALANAELYVEAAKAVVSGMDRTKLDRVVLVDHFSQTNTESFKNGSYLTEEGLLNANGHYEIAKQFAKRTFGSVDGFPAITAWTTAEAPEIYETAMPQVTAADNALNVAIPDEVEGESWSYKLQIGDMEIGGVSEERTFTIGELPEDAAYVLTVLSADGRKQLKEAAGHVTAGEKGGAPALSELQKEVRAKADGQEPLTWLFMGDSITHAALWTNGYDGIAQSFEKYLKEDLGRTDDIVINTAVSSADTVTTLQNIEQRLTKYTPDIVSIMLGTNDVAASGMSTSLYEANLKTIVQKIRERNEDASIIFRTPTPTNTNRAQALESGYLAVMKKVAEDDGNIIFIDQYTDWNNEMKTYSYLWGNRYYFGDTNLHPGAQGQLRMTQQFIRECGLDTCTRIADLSYTFSYTDSSSSVKPEISAGESTAVISRTALQTAYGQGNLGEIEAVFTDKETGTTYTQRTAIGETDLVMENLPTDRTYRVQVTGMAAGSTAKRVTFAEQDISLAKGQTIAFQVLLDSVRIPDISAGTEIGTLSVDRLAPEGTYSYSLCSGEGSEDNSLFVIDGTKLKVKAELEVGREYRIRVKAVNGTNAAETSFKLRTMPTLASVRREAAESFEADKMALDLDLSDVAFGSSDYVDLGDEDSEYYEGGAYLEVLNNLRENTTGGTIIYRFRTSQANAMIFGAGSSTKADNTNLLLGLNNGMFRGVFRTGTAGLLADFAGASGLGNGAWHTVAMSFDTTKADFQNQILISVDGSNNIFTNTSWWRDGWQSWFNITGQEITHFAIGGGIYAGLAYGGGKIAMEALNGRVSFVTVTDDVYTEEELKVLSETNIPEITGEQALTISGTEIQVPQDALYTASPLVWNEEETSGQFTLTASGDALFGEDVSVTITNAEELGIKSVRAERNGQTLTVTLGKDADVNDGIVFEREELTFRSGSAVYGDASLDSYVNELKSMSKGSVTVRYKLTDASISIPSALFSVSNGTYTNSYTSFYITPSTGTVGYEVRTQNGSGSTNVNTGSVALEDVKNTNWHTLTYTFGESGTKMYFDGVKVLENSNTGFFSSTEGAAYANLGCTYRTSSNAKAYPFTGEINYIQVSEEVLNTAEAEALHAATSTEALALPDTAVKTEPEKLFYSGYDNSVYYRIPTLFTTSKGTTIAGIDKRQSGSADLGNIDTSIRRSTDGGESWSDPQIIFNQPAGSSEHSLTIDPLMVEDQNGRIHLLVDLFPESRAAMNTGILERGSGFKTVGDKQYPILRNYANTSGNASSTWTREYTIREDGVVWLEKEDGTAEETNYHVPEYLSAEGCGDLYETVNGVETYRGNIYIYTGSDAGTLKVPRMMNLVTCYSDDDGETWEGYRNITGMVKEDWMLFLGLGPGVGICLKNQKDESLNGRLVVPVYSTNSTWTASQSSSVIYSDDNGETWHLSNAPLRQVAGLDISTESFNSQVLTEAQVVEMNDGTLKMFCRNLSGKVKICTGTAVSMEEGGVNWTSIDTSDTPEVYCQLSAIHYPEEVDGKEAVILSNPAGGGRNNGYIRVGLYQEDGSFDWKYGQLIKEAEYAYSCATILPNGNIGVLYEGANADTFFTSMNLEWLTAPRYTSIEQPVITDIQMEQTGSSLSFRVKLDAYLMKKADPVLKLKVDGVEKDAAYVSGNAEKEYVFTYDPGSGRPTKIEAVNVGVAEGDTESFIEGATCLQPEDVSFVFYLSTEEIRKELKEELENLAKPVLDGGDYTEESWTAFRNAYDAAEKALDNGVTDGAVLEKLLEELRETHAALQTDSEAKAAREELKQTLAQYKDTFEKDQEKYTEGSWKVFADAYGKVQQALTDGVRDKAALAALNKQLTDAYGRLALKTEEKLRLQAPAIRSLKAVAEKKHAGVKITVQKVTGADTYTVYRVYGKKTTCIGNTNASGVVYDENPISNKKVSYYAVASSASVKYQASDKGAAKSIRTLAAAAKVTAKQAGKQAAVRITWKKVKNAKQYIIYRSRKKSSGYTRIKVLKGKKALSFTDKKVKKGKKYYYRVVAKTNKGYSAPKTSKVVKVKK